MTHYKAPVGDIRFLLFPHHLMPACHSLTSQALAGAETLDAMTPEELSAN